MIIKSLLNILADGSGVLKSVMTHHGDDLIDAIKNGNHEQFLKGVANGAEVLADPKFIRIMGRLGDSLEHIDDLEKAVKAGKNITDDLVKILDDDALAKKLAGSLDDAVKASVGATDDMIRSTDEALSAADKAKKAALKGRFSNYLNSAPTRLQMIGMALLPHVAIYAYAQADREGRIPMAIMKQGAEMIADNWEEMTRNMTDEEKLAHLTEEINRLEAVKDFVFPQMAKRFVQNFMVEGAWVANDYDPQAAIDMAVVWQFNNPVLLTSKLTIRSLALQKIYEDMPAEERYEMLAKGFVDDVIEGAQCATISDNGIEITEKHVLAMIREHANTLNSLPTLAGLRIGLVEAYPELGDALDTSAEPDPSVIADNKGPEAPKPGNDEKPSPVDGSSVLATLKNGDWRSQGSAKINQTYNQLVSATGAHDDVDFWSCCSMLLGFSDPEEMSMTNRFNAYADLAKFMTDNPLMGMILGFIGNLFGADIPGVGEVKKLAVEAAAGSDSVMANMSKQFGGAADPNSGKTAGNENDGGEEKVAMNLNINDPDLIKPGTFGYA